MIESPIRLTVEWMTDEVTGINAQLPNVPRPDGESAPPPAQFYDELRHDWVARNIIHRDATKDLAGLPCPAVIIRFPELEDESALRFPVLPEFEAAGAVVVPVSLEYARRKIVSHPTPATHSAMVREARQTMRTACRVIAQHFENAHQVYTVDGCTIGIASSGVQTRTRFVDAGDDMVLDSLLIPFVVLDPWALGIT